MGKAAQEHDKSLDMLREYFMSKRGERAQEIAAKRAEQDSRNVQTYQIYERE